MRPLTDTMPKCLLPIRGIPVLAIWLELCRRHHIDEVLVNTHAHSETVRRYLAENSQGVRAQITEEPALLGSAGTLLANRDWVGSDPYFWVFYTDILTNANLTRMLEFHSHRGQIATLGLHRVSNPQESGIVTVDREKIVQGFEEKPKDPFDNLAFAGILVAAPAIFDLIPRQVPADLGRDLLPKLCGKMAAYPIAEYVVDIGMLNRYQKAQTDWPGLDSPQQVTKQC